MNMKRIIIALVVIAVVGLGVYFIADWWNNRLYNNPDFASGNGRIEATEIYISARLAGKIEKVNVLEGEKVEEGQALALMQTNVLVAELEQAKAKLEQTVAAEKSARAQVGVQEALLVTKRAELEREQSTATFAENNYKRYKTLIEKDAASRKHFEAAESEWLAKKADLAAAEAAVREAEANLAVAKANLVGAKANILAAKASIARISADIDDSILRAPLSGRIQYRVSEPGEVLSAGGRVLNMVDLTDVYMTFFLPERAAGKVRIGSDVRIVLDALPACPLPAKVSYVASVAQFTPKTVETRIERQKLMFRVKAHIDRNLLMQYIDLIKTGIPGVAWVKLNDATPWPKQFEISPEAKQTADRINTIVKSQQKVTPTSVVKSETADQAKKRIFTDEEIKAAGSTGTREKDLKVETVMAQKLDASKKVSVEKSVQHAQKDAAKKSERIKDAVDQAVKADESARTDPRKGSVK